MAQARICFKMISKEMAQNGWERLKNNQIFSFQLPSQSLLWRAILQVILLKHEPNLSLENQQVGRIAAKSANFVDYVERAFVKLNLDLKMSKNELEELYENYSQKFGHKLNGFYQIRSLFAPLIEGIILLDRLTFLLQQVIIKKSVYITLKPWKPN